MAFCFGIAIYSYNQPHVFVETNIRTVYLQHFFPNDIAVSDKRIQQIVNETLDREDPRQFYWAVMDYGAQLKKQGKGQLARSVSHKKQARFAGSQRQLRGRVLRELQGTSPVPLTTLHEILQDSRLDAVFNDLAAESLIQLRNDHASL